LLGLNKKVNFSFKNGKCNLSPMDIYPNLPSGGYAWVIKLEGVGEGGK
jgi:hypothetical protein